METNTAGFTFTRVSPIYDREGNPISDQGANNILDATRSVIYYDDSAVYYGEHVGRSGLAEDKVDRFESDTDSRKTTDDMRTPYYRYSNMDSTGGEYQARNLSYITKNIAAVNAGTADFIRIGDHSHVTNQIQYYNETGDFLEAGKYDDQTEMIEYLNSSAHPVGIANSAENNTYDFGISDFWTFIPAMPAKMADTSETIQIIDGDAFNLTGQVFYDKNSNGTYDSMADSDTLLTGVTLNLYRQTDDPEPNPDTTYYTVSGNKVEKSSVADSFVAGIIYYELFHTDVTPVEGRYFFTNIPYDRAEGTSVVYEVIRPNSSYILTSQNTAPQPIATTDGVSYGPYALYAYDNSGSARGTEVQVITVGGSGVNPNVNEMNDPNHTITAVDVGYHYELNTKLTLKKTWAVNAGTTTPEPAVFEVCYVDSDHKSHVFAEQTLSEIQNLEYSYELLPAEMGDAKVEDWYVAAEYYIQGNKLFKHTFDYEPTNKTYTSFVGKSEYIELTDNGDSVYDQKDIEDTNGDNVRDWNDLEKLTGWTATGGDVPAPYHAVLDRNPGTAEITISITNSDDPGVIEILKYTGTEGENNYLQGATFRLYAPQSGDTESSFFSEVQKNVTDSNSAEPEARAAALAWLLARQVGSNSTRANGKVAFAGLDPTKHYVLREMYPPTGYRTLDDLYLIHPKSCGVEEHNYWEYLTSGKQPEGMEDEEWDTWQRQNFRFGDNAYVQAAIANIPINGDMAIRKQIDGRAWNNGDSFTFDIAFRDASGVEISVPEPLTVTDGKIDLKGAVVIDEAEYNIVKGSDDGTGFRTTLNDFITAFNKTDKSDIVITNLSDPAKNVITLVDGGKVEELLPDTNQSVPLIVNGEITYDESGEPIIKKPDDAQLNTSAVKAGSAVPQKDAYKFPAAGTYTFTVSENALIGGTLNSSPRVFTMVVKVTRTLDPGLEPSTPMTVSNTYLKAEVEDIYYQDPKDEKNESPTYPGDYSPRRVYAGVAPTFTNTYYVQPAIQTTSYAITKTFTGRLDENGQPLNSGDGNVVTNGWLAGDRFYVTIKGADPETEAALTAGNIYIGGLHGKRVNGTFDTEKAVRFNQTNVTNPQHTTAEVTGDKVNDGHTFTFDEIDFQKLEFPVKWVFSDEIKYPTDKSKGDPVPEEDKDTHKNVVVHLDDKEIGDLPAGSYFVVDPESKNPEEYYPVVSRTEDIVYKLEIREYTPDGATDDFTAKGITYDQQVYTLVITLKNAPDGETSDTVDGIVDELDFKLYACAAGDIKADTVPQATCETDQKVVTTFKDWAEAKFDDTHSSEITSGWTKKWYYVNNSTGGDPVIREAKVEGWEGGIEGGTPAMFSVDIPDAAGTTHRTIHIVDDGDSRKDQDDYYTFDSIKKDRDITFIAKREGHTDAAGTSGHIMTFSNTYAATGTWTPMIHKTVEGRDWQADESFTFELACTKWPGEYNPLSVAQTITVGESESASNEGTGSFDKITFTAPGEYEFTIKETGTGMGLGTKDKPADIALTVVAEDNDDGTLKLAVEGKDGTTPPDTVTSGDSSDAVASTINFVNAYSEEGSFNIAIEKTLTGRAWNDSETFTFTVTPDDDAKTAIEGDKLTVPTEWTLNSDGTYTVTVSAGTGDKRTVTGTLSLANHGTTGATYGFTVKEDTTSFGEKAIYCAQPEITLTVTVSSGKESDGRFTGALLTVAYLGETDTGHLPDPYTLPFTNRYYVDTEAPGTGDESADQGFTVAKSFTGRSGGDWLASDTFTATVTFDPDQSTGSLENVFFKEADGTYSEIKDGTFEKKVTFDKEDQPPESFDFRFFAEGRYVFNVAETKGSIPGVKYDETKYTVTFDVTLTGANTLEVTRAITGGSVTGGSIVFTNVYEPAHATWTPSVTKEIAGDRDWVTNDSFTFKLERTGGDADGVTMPSDPTLTITDGSKKGDGEHTEYKESFGTVTFTKVGEYDFTITESDPGNYIRYSGAYTIHASVSDDTENGKLTLALTKGTVGSGDSLGSTTVDNPNVDTTTIFTNTYRQEQGKFTLAIQKTLEGRAWEAGESFTFTVTPGGDYGDNLAYPGSWTPSGSGAYTFNVTNSGSEKTVTQSLGEITINTPGTYVFTIAETPSEGTYCPEPTITLTVNAVRVTDNGVPTGEMQVITTYATSDGHSNLVRPDTEGATTVPFINYAYAEADFTLHKTLNGRNWGTDEEFHAEVELIKADLGDVELEDGPVVDKETGQHLSEGGAITLAMKETVGATADFRFLAAGTYTFEVTEVHGRLPGITYDSSVYTVTVEVTADSAGALAAADPVIQKNGVDETSISFHNDYDTEPITGGLTVTKTVLSNSLDTDTEFNFTVKLDDESVNGPRGGMYFENGVATFTLINGMSVTAVGLPAGTHYTVTEAEANTGDWHTASTGAQGTIPEEGVAEANFTNTAEGFEDIPANDVGGLVISTYVTGFGDQGKDWHFDVVLSSATRAVENDPRDCVYYKDGGTPIAGKVTFKDGVITGVNIDGMGSTEKIMLHHKEHIIIYGLTPEETYTVHEVEEGQDGYVTSTVHTTSTIPHHSIASAVIVNDLEPEDIPVGSLTVYKTVAGDDGETNREFDFTLTLTDGERNLVNGTFNGVTFTSGAYSFVLKNGGHMTLTGLPAGYHYVVSENSAAGYTVSSTGATGDIEANVNATARFVNTVISTTPLDPGNGLLIVTKTVTGNAGDSTQDFTFTVTLSGNVAGEPFNGGNTATFDLADGGSRTFQLPAGTFYTVTEAPAEGYTTTSTNPSGTIREGQTSVASFVNDRTIATGNLTVTKTVTGDQGDRDREWSFQVELGRKLNGSFGDTKFTDGVAEFKLKHGGSITFTGLPAEISYTVRETDANTGNYTTTAEGDTGFIPANDTVLASFVNAWHAPTPSRRTGSLTVSKTVAGEGGDTERAWRFRVELDQKLTGVYGGMTFADGAAEFDLKHGGSVTARNLPEGVAYTVTELDADQEGYATDAVDAAGTIANGVTAQAVFTNTKTDEPPVEPTDPPAEPTDDPSVEPTDDPAAGPTDDPPADPTDTPSDGPQVDPPDGPHDGPPDDPHTKPSDDAPKTGDNSHLGFWFALMILGLIGLVVVAILDPEKRRSGQGRDKRAKK